MKLIKLLQVQNKKLTPLTFSQITPIQLQQQHTLNTTCYLTIEYKKNNKDVTSTVNLSLLFLETIIGKQQTWQDIVDKLTLSMIDSYQSKHIDIINPEKYVQQISVMNSSYLEAHYTTVNSPDLRDSPTLMWKLQDLVITQKTDTPKDKKIDFTKCLCSVNGLLSKPIVFNDELFMPKGTTFMMNSSQLKWPDIVLLDFSTLCNDMKLIPLSECIHKVLRPGGALVDGCDIELTLPNTDLTNKSVLLVIGHTLILHDNLYVTGKNKIHITPYKYPLHKSLLWKKHVSQEYIPNTDIYRSYEETVYDYIYKNMYDKNHHGAFIVVLDTPDLFIVPMKITKEHNRPTLRTKDSLGIVRRLSTWGIVDYVVDHYNNIDILNLNTQTPLYQLDELFISEQIGMDHFKCNHNDLILDITESGYEMFRILS